MRSARSLAAAQTIPKRGDVDHNVSSHADLIHAAAEEQAQVLVFPELSLTGYELDLADELAFSDDDPRLEPLSDLANSCDMTLVVGAPVRIGPGLFIGAFVLLPDRRVEFYTKQHLGAFPSDASPDGIVPPAEDTVFQPGNRDPLVDLAGSTAALAVCADTGRPAHPEKAAGRGAMNYLASMFVIPSDLENELARLAGYAAHHSMAVVMANYGGATGGLESAGRSAIWSERGELLAQLEENGSGLAVASEGDAGWRPRTVMLGSS
jgi:predicted amidohydrolase